MLLYIDIIMANLEESFSLNDSKQYKNSLMFLPKKVIEYYLKLCCHYILVLKNSNLSSQKTNFKFISARGLDTLTIIFQLLFLYTLNVELAYYHTDKSMYLYIEFITQLDVDDNHFLQLTSRDAVNYIYKKTLFAINQNYKKEKIVQKCDKTIKKIHTIDNAINIIKTITMNIINNELIPDTNEKCEIFFKFLLEKLNLLTNKSSSKSFIMLNDDIKYDKIKTINSYTNLIDEKLKKV